MKLMSSAVVGGIMVYSEPEGAPVSAVCEDSCGEVGVSFLRDAMLKLVSTSQLSSSLSNGSLSGGAGSAVSRDADTDPVGGGAASHDAGRPRFAFSVSIDGGVRCFGCRLGWDGVAGGRAEIGGAAEAAAVYTRLLAASRSSASVESRSAIALWKRLDADRLQLVQWMESRLTPETELGLPAIPLDTSGFPQSSQRMAFW
ncbi:hypothetical protein DFJ73DRAFT_766531 [Zopfochytrium polystomum]|nr:hypothetical protein DFJ73DRAFT_766531 [Zopfochytrium polystomum]